LCRPAPEGVPAWQLWRDFILCGFPGCSPSRQRATYISLCEPESSFFDFSDMEGLFTRFVAFFFGRDSLDWGPFLSSSRCPDYGAEAYTIFSYVPARSAFLTTAVPPPLPGLFFFLSKIALPRPSLPFFLPLKHPKGSCFFSLCLWFPSPPRG